MLKHIHLLLQSVRGTNLQILQIEISKANCKSFLVVSFVRKQPITLTYWEVLDA